MDTFQMTPELWGLREGAAEACAAENVDLNATGDLLRRIEGTLKSKIGGPRKTVSYPLVIMPVKFLTKPSGERPIRQTPIPPKRVIRRP